MTEIILIAHNLRSSHNVGSLLRTAEGLGITKVYFTGYTPYPVAQNDERLPHISAKVAAQIHKTALGAESMIPWEHESDVFKVLRNLCQAKIPIFAVEQASDSVSLPDFQPPEQLALMVGREIEGIELEVLRECDGVLEIPMKGDKESFNVAQAAAMALYHCRYSHPKSI